MDLAAITSVSNLINVPGDPSYITAIKAAPFVGLILLDIVSQVLILIYHDIPLCNHEDEKIKKHIVKFQLGRIIQLFVVLAWIGALVYMVLIVRDLHCVDRCTCQISNPALNCSAPLCPVNCGTRYCAFSMENECLANVTISLPGEYSSFEITNCSITTTAKLCQQSSPSIISCVLLGIILFEGIYTTVGIFFKSYLMPITLPDYVMFQLYLMNNNIDDLINRFGKSEFGFHWSTTLLDTLIEQ